MEFPGWVAWMAADPVRGIPRHIKFRPSIAEVADYCSALYGEKRRENERAKALNAQLEERARLPSPDDFPDRRAAVVDKVLERLGPHFGIEQPADKAVSIPPLETVMAQYPGGPMAGLKLSEATLQTNAVQETFRRLREVQDEGDYSDPV